MAEDNMMKHNILKSTTALAVGITFFLYAAFPVFAKETQRTAASPGHGDVWQPGVVTGDVDGDGDVTAADARLALRAAVALEAYLPGSSEYLTADADGDGALSSADARLILRMAVGLEAPVMAPKPAPVGVPLTADENGPYLLVKSMPLGDDKLELQIIAARAQTLSSAAFYLYFTDDALQWERAAQNSSVVFARTGASMTDLIKSASYKNAYKFACVWSGEAGRDSVVLAECILTIARPDISAGQIAVAPVQREGAAFALSFREAGYGACLGPFTPD